jgi:hypothetical protein
LTGAKTTWLIVCPAAEDMFKGKLAAHIQHRHPDIGKTRSLLQHEHDHLQQKEFDHVHNRTEKRS